MYKNVWRGLKIAAGSLLVIIEANHGRPKRSLGWGIEAGGIPPSSEVISCRGWAGSLVGPLGRRKSLMKGKRCTQFAL